jgi:hypothetical protein
MHRCEAARHASARPAAAHGLRSTGAAGRACAARRPAPAQGPELAIHHGDAVLAAMNEWSERQHGGSGLTQRCRESAVSMRDAEDQARVPACALGCTPVAEDSMHAAACCGPRPSSASGAGAGGAACAEPPGPARWAGGEPRRGALGAGVCGGAHGGRRGGAGGQQRARGRGLPAAPHAAPGRAHAPPHRGRVHRHGAVPALVPARVLPRPEDAGLRFPGDRRRHTHAPCHASAAELLWRASRAGRTWSCWPHSRPGSPRVWCSCAMQTRAV